MNETLSPGYLSGRPLPEGLHGGAVVEHGGSFLIIGGYAGSYSNKILKYTAEGEWEEMPGELSEGKQTMVAMSISSNQLKQC